jgi:hypothetical protein
MYIGPPIDDREILDALPAELRHLLELTNGYVAYYGGLHVRGACHAPEWHSLRAAWFGENALHALFPAIKPADIPFAEDAFGDQYVLRSGAVCRLSAESGELEPLGLDLMAFDSEVRADPIGFLALAPLEAFRARGGALNPGQLLNVYPPFIAKESSSGVSYRAISALEQRRWLADLARQLRNVPDGTRIRFRAGP